MLPEELRNKWKEEILEDWPGTSEGMVLLRKGILKEKENAYLTGLIDNLRETVEHYREMYAEDDCNCLHCILDRPEEDEDEDGMGRDGLPVKPIKPTEEETEKLESMWTKE